MNRLYIASTEPQAGKTVLAGAIAHQAAAQGVRATYRVAVHAPPTGAADTQTGAAVDAVAAALGVDPAMAPAPVMPDDAGREALATLEADHDLVVVDGASGGTGGALPDGHAEMAAALDATVILIVWYDEYTLGEGEIDSLRAGAAPFEQRLGGIVLNAVPESRTHYAETVIAPAAEAAGLPPVTVIPQDRLLSAPTLRDIVTFLDAEVVAYPDKLDVLVPRIMIGALALDGGIYYYGQADEKTVITRWDRPDLQMPALATGCQGLILTGGEGPIPYVQARVDELKVPVAVVRSGTVATASRLNDGLLAGRGTPHADKVRAMASQLAAHPALMDVVLDGVATPS